MGHYWCALCSGCQYALNSSMKYLPPAPTFALAAMSALPRQKELTPASQLRTPALAR